MLVLHLGMTAFHGLFLLDISLTLVLLNLFLESHSVNSQSLVCLILRGGRHIVIDALFVSSGYIILSLKS